MTPSSLPISAHPAIGRPLAGAMERVGGEGVIAVEAPKTIMTALEAADEQRQGAVRPITTGRFPAAGATAFALTHVKPMPTSCLYTCTC